MTVRYPKCGILEENTGGVCRWGRDLREVHPASRAYQAGSPAVARFSRDFQLVQNPFNLKIFQRFINDNTHRTVFIVFTNINHGAAKNRVPGEQAWQ